MRRRLIIIGLELYALLLAFLQLHIGVRTDEAKYLLNIPYPHPPLIRTVQGWFDGWVFQEHFFRILYATLLIQAVWLVWSMGSALPKKQRSALCGLWLFCGGVVFQAGTIMMAPLTALQLLLFVWLYVKKDRIWSVWTVGLLWLGSLFTAYQAVLFAPLIIILLHRASARRIHQVIAFLLPVGLLGLYSLANPLALASMLLAGDVGGASATSKLLLMAHTLMIAGSGILSITGVIGLFRSQQYALTGTLLPVLLYVFVSPQSYYAVLFVPLLIAGIVHVPKLLPATLIGTAVITAVLSFVMVVPRSSEARIIMHLLEQEGVGGTVLIEGPFGHQWQYEAPESITVERYRQDAADDAAAIICLKGCSEEIHRNRVLLEMEGIPVEVRR